MFQVVCVKRVASDTVPEEDKPRPQGKNTDLKSVNITIRRNKVNNSNNNNNNNNNNNINNNNNNNSDDNLFKLVCPQSLVHNERMQAIFKCKTQQTLIRLTEEKVAGLETKTNK